MRSWMSYSLLWARKKRNLRPNHCGSRDPLRAELGGSAGANFGNSASLPGTSPTSQTVLLGCLPAYDTLYYGAPYEMRTDKHETYSVEAVNADLRHYLKRLARKSRCFTRRMQSLAKNIQLFVYCYNHRQLAKRLFPKYSFHLVDFISLLV